VSPAVEDVTPEPGELTPLVGDVVQMLRVPVERGILVVDVALVGRQMRDGLRRGVPEIQVAVVGRVRLPQRHPSAIV
jgi:hypothetical protein